MLFHIPHAAVVSLGSCFMILLILQSEKKLVQRDAVPCQSHRVSRGWTQVLLLLCWRRVQGLGDVSPVDSGQTLHMKDGFQPCCQHYGLGSVTRPRVASRRNYRDCQRLGL